MIELPAGSVPLDKTVKMNSAISDREAQVLAWLYTEHSSAQIGALLGISHRTVKFHMTRIFLKMKVKSRLELMALEIKRLEDEVNG